MFSWFLVFYLVFWLSASWSAFILWSLCNSISIASKHQQSFVSAMLCWGDICSEPVRSLSLMLCCQALVNGQHHSSTVLSITANVKIHTFSLPTKATFLASHHYRQYFLFFHLTYDPSVSNALVTLLKLDLSWLTFKTFTGNYEGYSRKTKTCGVDTKYV